MRTKLTLLDYIRESEKLKKEEGALLHLLSKNDKSANVLGDSEQESREVDLVIGDFQNNGK